MALGILTIVYIVLLTATVIIQGLLYENKDDSKNVIFILNMLLALLLAYIVYTSLPTNFVGQRILAVVWAGISIVAMVVKLKAKQFAFASKIMFSVAIFGCLAQIFL